MDYDIIIIGAGPGGIYSAYELTKEPTDLKIAVFEAGNPLEKRRCPIDGEKITSCVRCKTCAIMSGFGGAGGVCMPAAIHSHPVQPGGFWSPGRTSGSNLFSPYR